MNDIDEFDDSFDEPVIIDFNVVKNNISNYNSNKLCEMIVCNNYFKINEDITILCMQELSKRRVDGDLFNFEGYIKSCESELPVINMNFNLGGMFLGLKR